MIGFLSGLISYLVILGFTLVETIIFTTAFNYLAPYMDIYEIEMPFTHVQFWHVFAFILLIHIIGKNIARIFPTFVNIDNSNNSDDSNNENNKS